MLRLGYRPEASPPPPAPNGWQRFAESTLPALFVGITVFLVQSHQGGSKDLVSKIDEVQKMLPAMIAKLEDICKRETKNRENDEKYRDSNDLNILELKEQMARVQQRLNLSPP